MKSLTFTLLSEPPERLDLSPLVPARLAGMAAREVEKIRLGLSKRGLMVGDVFRLSGGDASTIIFEGGSRRFDGVGTRLTGGTIRVAGDVGAQVGRRMSDGTILIEGSAGLHAGSGMSGGRLEILGDAGDFAAGPLAGELAGMSGGTLIVRGRAGDRAGDRMRRGLLAVLGGCGDYAGSRMIAGTVAIMGASGRMPGYLMRRGSILIDHVPEMLSPSFVESGVWNSAFASIVDRHLIEDNILREPLLHRTVRRYCGDNAVLGKGEILISAEAL